MNVFGPVPSRRLGKSVGINNIPPKICTYSCCYCQLGRSLKMTANRQRFYTTEELCREVETKLENASRNNEEVDYLTIVPDGEPTLDNNLSDLFDAIQKFGVKTAIITNSSLMDLPDVRDAVAKADWVSIKIDTVSEEVWRKVDHPHRRLDLDAIMNGLMVFSEDYNGRMVTETMLVRDVNDGIEHVRETAAFIGELEPAASYVSVPIRPPAEDWALPPDEETINRSFQMISEHTPKAELLTGYEGNEFAYTGNIEEDILSITSVHPMREDAVAEYLKKARGEYDTVQKLVDEKKLIVTEYSGNRFYMRSLKNNTA